MISSEELEEYRLSEKKRQHQNAANRRSYKRRYMRGYYYSEEGHKRIILNNAKRRAAKRGVPFDLKPEDINVPEFCPVLGLKLEINKGGRCFAANSPSLDRIIPELGYTKGSVEIISMRANNLKSDGTLDELRKVVAWLESKVGG